MMIAAMPLHRCWNDADESGRRGARLWPRRAGHRHVEIIVPSIWVSPPSLDRGEALSIEEADQGSHPW